MSDFLLSSTVQNVKSRAPVVASALDSIGKEYSPELAYWIATMIDLALDEQLRRIHPMMPQPPADSYSDFEG